jgi:thiol-disulfide isomerase/thioredoxin
MIFKIKFVQMSNRFLKEVFFVFLIIILNISVGCQNNTQGFLIDIEIKNGLAGDIVFLQKYQGKSLITIDSVSVGSDRKIVFKGIKPLEQGMYAITFQQNTSINFFISDTIHQHFSIGFDLKNPVQALTFTGSPENQAFTNYLRFLEIKQKQKPNPQLQAEIKLKGDELEKEFAGTMLALFIRTIRDTEIPEPNIPLMVTNREQALQQYYHNYMAAHFFDNIDFSDKRLLNMPVLEQKIGVYFQQLINPQPDSLIKRIDVILAKAKASNEVYNWSVRYLYDLFRKSPIPGHSEVYCYLGDHYILSDSARWNDLAFVEQVRYKISKAKLNPVGLPATNLKLQTPQGKNVELYSIQSPLTVLYFFNPGCDACKPITRELYKLYKNYQYKGLLVFAVYVDKQKQEWLDYITSNCNDWMNVYDPESTAGIEQKYDINAIPMIYILDNDKKVIAKDISIKNLETFLLQGW